MRTYTVDYSRDRSESGTLISRGFWVHDIPRLTLACRLLGHRPVIDGYGPHKPGLHAARWVCCDRCGIRPDPQGVLDHEQWGLGDRYTGPFGTGRLIHPVAVKRLQDKGIDYTPAATPGPWPAKPTGTFGGQIVLGRSLSGWSIEFKVGNQGSEQPLAMHIGLHPFGALYLHTEDHGRWIQRRLNPTGYESRVTGLAIQRGGIDWKLWAKRDTWSKSDPWWSRGTIKLDPRDRLLGRSHYDYTDVGHPVTAPVRMPHGDDHQVQLKLQRCTDGRRRRRFHSWSVDWDCRGGIPTKPGGRGTIHGASVKVSTAAVNAGTWPAEASAAIAANLTACRTQHDYKPPAPSATPAGFNRG